MTAQLAHLGDRLLPHAEDPCAVRHSSVIPSDASDQPKIGGIQFDSGYISPYFITDPEHMEVAFENAYILVSEGTVSSRNDLLPLLEQIKKRGRAPLIIAVG